MCPISMRGRRWLVCLSIALVWGCDWESTTGPAPVPVPVTPADTVERVGRVVISKAPERLTVGDSIQLVAVVLSQTNTRMAGLTVRWSSSDPEVARVSEQGVVRAERVGSTAITASVGDKVGGVSITVSGSCTQLPTIEVGQARTGTLSSNTICFLRGEPVDGWRLNLTAPALLQIDLNFADYFAHLVITDAELRPIAESYRNTMQGVTLRSQLAAGSYIIWVGADGDDGAYDLYVNAVPSGASRLPPPACLTVRCGRAP